MQIDPTEAPRPELSPAEQGALTRAVELARRGLGEVEPNPMVGAVVLQGDRIVGEGWHRAYGGPHAEVEALAAAGADAAHGTLVVTLEPCCTTGKTPPCTRAVVEAGIARVVVGAIDPDARHAGRGLTLLRGSGLDVELLQDPDCVGLLSGFEAGLERRRPHVIAKWAMGRDGTLAAADGAPVRLTGPEADARVQHWRRHLDGLLVGVQTVVSDDPRLTWRGEGEPLRPLRRIVLDPTLRIPPTAGLVSSAGETPTWVLARDDADEAAASRLEDQGVVVARLPAGERWLQDGLDWLGTQGVGRLMVEGGARTLAAFLDARLVDQLAVFVCDRELGPEALPALPGGGLGGLSPHELAGRLELLEPRVETLGADTLLRGRRAVAEDDAR